MIAHKEWHYHESMSDEILQLEPGVRTTAFLATVATLLLAERRWARRPARALSQTKANIGLLITNTAVARLLSATSVVGFSLLAADSGWGLLGSVAMPNWLEIIAAFLLLDFAIYWQHRIFHLVPWLWRLHAVHHADRAFDVSTAVRFHPLEIVISLGFKISLVLLIGAPPWAVLCFEAMLSSASLFNHANLSLPRPLESALRAFIVTPDMHRVHHSVAMDEHNLNFGFLASGWDRLFRTYRANPRVDHDSMPIGLEGFEDDGSQTYWALLKQPFARPRNMPLR